MMPFLISLITGMLTAQQEKLSIGWNSQLVNLQSYTESAGMGSGKMPENKEQEPLDQPSADGCAGCILVTIVVGLVVTIIIVVVHYIIKFW